MLSLDDKGASIITIATRKEVALLPDKWGFRHTLYVATLARNLKDSHNPSLFKCSRIMAL